MKKDYITQIVIGLFISLVLFAIIVPQINRAEAAVTPLTSAQVGTSPVNGYILVTDGSKSSWTPNSVGGSSNWLCAGGSCTPSTTIGISLHSSSTIQNLTMDYATATTELVTNLLHAYTSAGTVVQSANGTPVSIMGVGNSANALFYGGVNIDGATRLATSLNGVAFLTNGAVTGVATSSLGINGSNWLCAGGRCTPSTTIGIGVFASSTIGNGTGAGGLTIDGGATTSLDMKVNGLTVGRGAGNGTTNTVLGGSSFRSNTTGSTNVVIGYNTADYMQTGASNVAIGFQALGSGSSASIDADGNTSIGYQSLIFSRGDNNVALGSSAGGSLSTGGENLFLGNFAGYYETGSNSFYIDNQTRTDIAGGKAGSLLYGTFNATPASQTLNINASTTVFSLFNKGFYRDSTGSVGATGEVLQTTVTGTDWVATSTLGITATGDGVSNWLCAGGRCTPSTTIGIGVFASSTIGNGTGAGGLTIDGGATTTGTAYFAGNTNTVGTGFVSTGLGIGAGATSPALKLEVRGTGGAPATSGSSQTGIARFRPQTGLDMVLDMGQYTSAPYGAWLQSTNGTDLSQKYAFVLNPNGGNVGIGSSTPSKTLSIRGSISFSDGLYDTASSSGSKGNVLMSQGTSTLWVATSTLFSSFGTVTSVDMSVPTGLSISGNPITTSGTLALTLTSGYNIPLTASTTAWNNFTATPSTVITAGTGIDWSGNTLNGVYTAGDGLTLTSEDFDCDTANTTTFGCLTSGDWNIFNNKLASTSIDTSAELATILTDETGTAGSVVFSVSPTLTGTTTLAYASTTGISGTNLNFTNATSTTSFFSGLGTFTNLVVNTLATILNITVTGRFDGGASEFEIAHSANPAVDTTGETSFNETTNSFSVATSTTFAELPIYPPFAFAFASSSWTGTSTDISTVTSPNFSELFTSGTCYANGTGKIVLGNGIASSSVVSLSVGTTTVTFNTKFNKGGTRIIFAIGTPSSLTHVDCKFERIYGR